MKLWKGGTPHDNVHFFQRYLDDPIDPKLVRSSVMVSELPPPTFHAEDICKPFTMEDVANAVKLLKEANVPAYDGFYSIAMHPTAVCSLRSNDVHDRLWRAIWKVSPSAWKRPCDAERVPKDCGRTYAEMSALDGRLSLEWRRWRRKSDVHAHTELRDPSEVFPREHFRPSRALLRDIGPVGRSVWGKEWDDIEVRP